LLETYGENAKILAGGQSLIPLMKYRLIAPAYLIDINRVKELSYVRKDREGTLRIGALTRHTTIENSDRLRKECRVLAEAASVIGDPHIRNRGTIGGSVAHMDPAADYLAALCALDCQIKVVSRRGERWLGWKEFFVGMYTTPLEPSEIVAEISIPSHRLGLKGVYLKLARGSGDFALASVAALVVVDQHGVCRDVSIGVGAVEQHPMKAAKAEAALLGRPINEAAIRKAAELAAEGFQGFTDIHATAEYRRDMVRVLTRRSLEKAALEVAA